MVVAMAKDIRVILVKLADRLHNMRTLEFLPEPKRRLIAQETLDIYAPLAHRLGIGWMKAELEDLAFRYLNPRAYEALAARLARQKEQCERYIARVQDVIVRELSKLQIPCRVSGRLKNLYSIYQKMQRQQLSFEDIHDILAVRVITDTVRNCYAILGVVHSLWKPVPGRFKDYIALPKPNMYQSLHTTVMGPEGERVELQIRTEEMHRTAEEGIAAHWRYKENTPPEKYDELFVWLRRLLEWQQDLKDPIEFMETVKIDMFPEEVYVFTPRGEVRVFPRGGHADRFCLRHPHRHRAPLRRGSRQRPPGAAALPATQWRYRRDPDVPLARAQPRLAALGGHLAGPHQNQGLAESRAEAAQPGAGTGDL
ncbi:MAG: hypothetical protein KatS3mg131_0405 [Candidatus Tectimicrobiota bacterium]|nr:MAG: hypothetical protein KatS3mg131_0405 [Candidatus Tectomicrobia bacterium]